MNTRAIGVEERFGVAHHFFRGHIFRCFAYKLLHVVGKLTHTNFFLKIVESDAFYVLLELREVLNGCSAVELSWFQKGRRFLPFRLPVSLFQIFAKRGPIGICWVTEQKLVDGGKRSEVREPTVEAWRWRRPPTSWRTVGPTAWM